MTDINQLGNNLSGTTGTGSFVGSDSHSLTGTLNWSGVTSFEIPNSATPTTSAAGQIALDTSITDYTPLVQFNDGTSSLYSIAMPTSDLTSNNGDIVVYNAAGNKFSFAAPSAASGKLIGSNYGVLTSDVTVFSTTYANTGLTVSYTPTNASNILFIWCSAFFACERGAGSLSERYGFVKLRRTTGTAADLSIQQLGMTNFTSSSSPLYQDCCANIGFTEVAGSTSSHTYILQVASGTNSIDTHIYSDPTNGRGSYIYVWELEV